MNVSLFRNPFFCGLPLSGRLPPYSHRPFHRKIDCAITGASVHLVGHHCPLLQSWRDTSKAILTSFFQPASFPHRAQKLPLAMFPWGGLLGGRVGVGGEAVFWGFFFSGISFCQSRRPPPQKPLDGKKSGAVPVEKSNFPSDVPSSLSIPYQILRPSEVEASALFSS